MKKSLSKIIFVLFLGILIIQLQNHIVGYVSEKEYKKVKISDGEFRAEFFSDNQLSNRNLFSDECKTFLRNVENEASYFPVAESSVDKSLYTSFVNSWMSERSYGGKRGHEGIDIMASKNIRGVYPVVSMSEGIVTNLGWLEKGGYRIGITSDSGIYYYYAHLESYANINEGQRVKAGELLGYMGDSGYGPEGTVGKFAVHLHVGIYLYDGGEEVSVNPYYILCYLENKKLKYAYS